MAPRQGAVARALLCAGCFMFVFVFDVFTTLNYGRETLLRIREEVCGLSFANTGLRCADFDACPTRGKQGQESGRGSREQSERTGRRYRHIRRTAEPLSGDATGFQRRAGFFFPAAGLLCPSLGQGEGAYRKIEGWR